VSFATPALLDRVRREVLEPTLVELERRGAPFRGVLYAGLMIHPDGTPNVVEFNCRLGDPETQAVLPLVRSGLAELFWRAAGGEPLSEIELAPGAAVTTVLAARGYPDRPERGAVIDIPEDLPDNVEVFHAGTSRDDAGRLVVSGGRVLAVTGTGATFLEAQAASRAAAGRIVFPGRQHRGDIGWREAARA
jgi:phosphoribosylamine--glycine ligase